MTKRKTVLKISVITTAVLLCVIILGITVFTEINERKKESSAAAEYLGELTVRFGKSTEELMKYKEEYADWEAVRMQLLSEELSFTEQELKELLADAYAPEDIERSQEWSLISGENRMKIIKTRGNIDNQISWNDVKRKLNLDLRSDEEKAGLKEKDIEYFKECGYSDFEIKQIGLIVLQKDSVKNVKKKLANGKSVKELNAEYGLDG